MQDYPHYYRVSASGAADGEVTVASDGLTDLPSMPPEEFGGPGGYWSPETLLVAAVADCFILSFRGIARASRLEWTHLECSMNGVLNKVDRVTRFTGFEVRAKLEVPAGTKPEKAERLLAKAEAVCMVTNSLVADTHLEATVVVAD